MKRPYFSTDGNHGDSKVSNIDGYFEIMNILMGRYTRANALNNYYVMHKTVEQLLDHVAFQFSAEEIKEMHDKLDGLYAILVKRQARCQQMEAVVQQKIRVKAKKLRDIYTSILERLKETNMLFPTEKLDFRPKSAQG